MNNHSGTSSAPQRQTKMKELIESGCALLERLQDIKGRIARTNERIVGLQAPMPSSGQEKIAAIPDGDLHRMDDLLRSLNGTASSIEEELSKMEQAI
jgi:hypothetical protein